MNFVDESGEEDEEQKEEVGGVWMIGGVSCLESGARDLLHSDVRDLVQHDAPVDCLVLLSLGPNKGG